PPTPTCPLSLHDALPISSRRSTPIPWSTPLSRLGLAFGHFQRLNGSLSTFASSTYPGGGMRHFPPEGQLSQHGDNTPRAGSGGGDRKSTRLNSSHVKIS